MRISTHPQAMGMALGLIGVIIFGATLPMTHIALGGFSPFFITFGRAVIASVAAGLTLLLLKKRWPRGQGAMLLGAGICVVYGFPIFSSIAMQTIPASHGGVILGILPLLTSIFAALVDGERPGPAFWAYGLAGAALVVFFSIRDSGFHLQAGDLWLFLAAITAALGYVLSAKVSRIIPGWEMISWALIITAPLSVVATLLVMTSGVHAPTGAELGALSYLGLMSMFGGFVFWNAGLALGGIARVAQVQLLQTFVTLAVSAVLLGEVISLSTIGFAVAVALIVWLGRKARIA
ncbi:multidrug transporter [Pararhizobium polonicum]|uniref:Multidrug transporter n=1 Tax=Pararhizobium polonicum TaxID=1612624 RepID=A0A1C7NVS3_9HYPH|nr:DMT family transporter [Pararhizobium polonicum]OBZ93137.1 multidrug transporter [Pararhizobium polonicum]